MIRIEEIILYKVSLKLRQPFSASFGTFQERSSILIEVKSEGISAWGESATLPFPFYNHEDDVSAFHVLEKHICPLILKQQPQDIESINRILSLVAGNNIAKAGVESAFWDLLAKRSDLPLYKMLGGVRNEIESGVVVTEFKNTSRAIEQITQYLEYGYKRIKLKISRGYDSLFAQTICAKFPKTRFMLDANAAYSLKDIDLFRDLDDLNLLMIEQPFAQGDLVEHAKLQEQLKTIICLDESIENHMDAEAAIKLKSCRAINIKPARVGGLNEAKAIHNLAASADIGVWCGGMLETGIGRSHNMATSTLPNYIYPGDISEGSRYYERDIIEPAISFSRPGILTLSERPGIGVEVLRSEVEKLTTIKLVLL